MSVAVSDEVQQPVTLETHQATILGWFHTVLSRVSTWMGGRRGQLESESTQVITQVSNVPHKYHSIFYNKRQVTCTKSPALSNMMLIA